MNARIADRTFPSGRSRREQKARTIGINLAILGMVFCSTLVVAESPAHAESQADAVGLSDSDVNGSLDALAKVLAGAVAQKEFRNTIHDSVAERFDGDTDVLWKALAKKPGAPSALAKISARETVDRLANKIPRLQIAVPKNFDTWNPADYTPLVAYMPEGVDDTKLKTITAYDAAGRSFQLDAQVAPKQPVIVLGLNERTSDSGQLLKNQRTTLNQQVSSDSLTSVNALTAAAAASTYQVRMTQIWLKDAKEPWTKGDAEISMRAKSRGCSGVLYSDSDWDNLNISGQVWSGPPRTLGSTTCDVVFYWWEDDGDNFDFELSYGDYKLGIKMDDGDDLIGGIQIPHSYFQGTSDDLRQWSALEQVTD